MFEFLKIQYKLGRITEAELYSLVGKRITEEQFLEISKE